MFSGRTLPMALAAVAILSSCTVPQGTVPKNAMHPDRASGLMLAPGPLLPDALRPSFGVSPGNKRTVMETLAAAPPSQTAPLFARYRAARASGLLAADEELIFPAADRDSTQTLRVAAANICAGMNATLSTVDEKPRNADGVREIGLRCK